MEPRQIRILFNGRYYFQSRSHTTPRALVAPLLHACSESRMLMKKLCKKEVLPFVLSDGSYVWINYDLDTIFSDCAQIRYLQIYIDPNMIQYLHLQCRVDQSTLLSVHVRHCMDMYLRHIWRLPNLTDVLLNLEAPDARPQLRSQPWLAVEYAVMVDHYATCKPAHFNLRITHTTSGPDTVLSRDNFLCLLQELRPSDIPNDVSQRCRLFEDPNAFNGNLGDKNSPIWKHVGCDCEQDTKDYQRRWEWRPMPGTAA